MGEDRGRPQEDRPREEQKRQNRRQEELRRLQACQVVQGSAGGPQGPRCQGLRRCQEGLAPLQQGQGPHEVRRITILKEESEFAGMKKKTRAGLCLSGTWEVPRPSRGEGACGRREYETCIWVDS